MQKNNYILVCEKHAFYAEPNDGISICPHGFKPLKKRELKTLNIKSYKFKRRYRKHHLKEE